MMLTNQRSSHSSNAVLNNVAEGGWTKSFVAASSGPECHENERERLCPSCDGKDRFTSLPGRSDRGAVPCHGSQAGANSRLRPAVPSHHSGRVASMTALHDPKHAGIELLQLYRAAVKAKDNSQILETADMLAPLGLQLGSRFSTSGSGHFEGDVL
jgi:hypothetical protein